jgi:antagonist of KipI
MGQITVLRAGPLTSVQDLGRPRHRALGISRGGALDLFAAEIANLLVLNPAEAGLLEVTLGGVRLRFADERRVAWCGGEFAVQIAGRTIPAGRPSLVRQGEELKIGASQRGCRAWLGIAGGVEVPVILDSCSTDLRSSFGGYAGRALQDGDELSLGNSAPGATGFGPVAAWGAPAEWGLTARHAPVLRVVRGAEWERFGQTARHAFLETAFRVSAQADRMGARLEGAELSRKDKGEMLSEAVAPGTIQVANNGQPILLLGDCQTIGGYPKIAHVITVDLAPAAQLQPNDVVRFKEVSQTEAVALFRARENDLELFRVGLSLRLG